MNYQILLLLILAIVVMAFNRWDFETKRKHRRDYYINEYLKSEEWKRKRYIVLKRDNWRCVYCGAPATQVHQLKYAKRNIERNQSNGLFQSTSLVRNPTSYFPLSPDIVLFCIIQNQSKTQTHYVFLSRTK